MNLTDDALIQVLSKRFAQSRKAFDDLTVVNRKLTEMNRRLEQSESLKSNFLSNIRNEINNPLNGIIGLATEIISLGHANEEVTRLASLICKEGNNLDFQLRNIFIAAELEAGQADPHPSTTDVITVLRHVIDSFCHSAADKSVVIELIHPSGEPLLFMTDPEKLQVIVSNILANAVEYSPEGENVTVSVAMPQEDALEISIADQGVGIAKEDIPRIFDRFVQLETGSMRSHTGHGLGLSITKALLDLLQGSITIRSTPGAGSTFTITLPPATLAYNENSFAEGGNLFIFEELSET